MADTIGRSKDGGLSAYLPAFVSRWAGKGPAA